MRQKAFTERPLREFNVSKDTVECSHRPLGPLTLCGLIHFVFQYILYQPVDIQYLRGRVSLDQRKPSSFLGNFHKCERIWGCRTEMLS